MRRILLNLSLLKIIWSKELILSSSLNVDGMRFDNKAPYPDPLAERSRWTDVNNLCRRIYFNLGNITYESSKLAYIPFWQQYFDVRLENRLATGSKSFINCQSRDEIRNYEYYCNFQGCIECKSSEELHDCFKNCLLFIHKNISEFNKYHAKLLNLDNERQRYLGVIAITDRWLGTLDNKLCKANQWLCKVDYSVQNEVSCRQKCLENESCAFAQFITNACLQATFSYIAYAAGVDLDNLIRPTTSPINVCSNETFSDGYVERIQFPTKYQSCVFRELNPIDPKSGLGAYSSSAKVTGSYFDFQRMVYNKLETIIHSIADRHRSGSRNYVLNVNEISDFF